MTVTATDLTPESAEQARVPALLDGLRATFASGRTLPLEWRRQQLGRLRALLTEGESELLEALRSDLGKPELEAFTTDLSAVLSEIDLARRNLGRWTRPRRAPTILPLKPGRSSIIYEPLGVVLIIAPWNYPVQLLLNPLVGALAAGNCAVLKPSEVTAATSAALARLVPRYLDAEAVVLVEGGVPETTALLEQRFDHIFYTGNGAVGRVVMAAAARHLTPVTLELGGKSPCIVAADANLRVAARRIAWGKFLNAGQTCVAPDYVLVERARESELIDRLAATVEEFYGADPRRSPDYGRIVSERHAKRLAALLEGADVAFGGVVDEAARYVAPTVLRNVRPDDPVMREEIFGPILPVIAVDDIDEAIAFVRAREKPLALYVFTEKSETARHVLDRTSSGGAAVNATLLHLANPALPFGGVGPSGMGSYHGRRSFETFSHQRSVLEKPTFPDPKVVYPPYTRFKRWALRRFL